MIITLKDCLVPECEGKNHRWEFERPTVRELERIEQTTGMDVEAFFEGLGDVETTGVTSKAIKTLLALVDVLHRRDGLRVPYEDIDLDFVSLGFEFLPGEADDDGDESGDEAGKDPDPTKPSPQPAGAAGRASTSGRARKAASGRKSTPTPSNSGGSTD